MNKSFTLIEILVVIVVIGVLSAFILVGMSSITSSANIAKGKAFLNSMDNSLLLSRVSEWKLDGNGTDSWSGKTATLVNSPTANPSCAQDSCYTFNGSSQYAWIADDAVFNFGSYMSAFVWVKASPQNGLPVFDHWDYGTVNQRSWTISTGYASPYNGIKIILSDNGIADSSHRKDFDTTAVAFDNNWHNIGFTWNNGTLLMYIDGKSVTYTSTGSLISNSLHNSTARLTMASYLSDGSPVSYSTGSIDDPRLYNQPIPTSEIQQTYFVGINKLFRNQGMGLNEFNDRLVELKFNLSSR